MSQITAVIKSGGKQFHVKEGDVLKLERVAGKPGDEISLDQVMLVTRDGDVKVGCPLVKDAKVIGKIIREIKGSKTVAFQYRRRKNYRRKVGHRQVYTVLQVQSIVG